MTNYFKVSRGVRQGCPLSPLLFILSMELLAQKICQNPRIKGIGLPNAEEVKLSQFADDMTLICKDIASLTENMTILNSFAMISDLNLNRKKTKAMWIGSLKENKTKPLKINFTKDPVKTLGAYISYNYHKNNNENVFIKIQKMQTKLNLWLSRDLTLMGRTLLVKALGISKLVYTASMLTTPEEVIKSVQEKLFNFLWRNKRDKIKREVLFQNPNKGGLNFPNFRTTVKALRLSWISRLLNDSNATWNAIPNSFFNKYGGLPLLKCNYNSKHLDKSISSFHLELLDYFKELRSYFQDEYNSDLILWNNQDITTEGKSLYWKHWVASGIYFIHDILNEQGKYLTYEEFKCKYKININFINYLQILPSIPTNLKSKAASTMRPLESSLQEHNIFNLSNNKSILLNRMRSKDYYTLFQEKAEIIPTSVKSWSKKYPNVADKWKELFHNISHLSIDNKLKQFSFKLLHRILVTKKELKRFKIALNDRCFFCKRPDSLEYTFLECSAANKFFCECLLWFNNEHHTDFNSKTTIYPQRPTQY